MPRFTPNPIQPHVLRDYRAMLRQGNQPLSALTILSGQFVARSWRSPGRSTRVLSLDREASINRLLPLYMHTASSGSCRISSGHVTCGNCACTDSVSAISDAAVPKRTLPLHPRPARVTDVYQRRTPGATTTGTGGFFRSRVCDEWSDLQGHPISRTSPSTR